MENEEITTVEGLAAALDAGEGQAQEAPAADQEGAAEQADGNPQADPQQQAEEAEGEGEAAAEDAGQAVEAPADDAVVKWHAADGSDIEVPISELKASYLRHSDYTQKTQQLAEERKQAAEQIAQQFQQVQEFAHEQAQLMQLQEQLSVYAKADWNALYQQDPAEAGRLQAQWMLAQQRAQQIAQGYQAKVQQRQAEQAKMHEQRTQEALTTLQREIPGFGDVHLKAMRDVALAHGFTDGELAHVSDARTLKVLHEAAQWRALQAQKPAVQNKVKAAPPKATKPGAATVPSSRAEVAWKQMASKRDVGSLAAFLMATEK